MKYPLENLTDPEFEDLVALICERILGMGTVVFSVGKDGGKDARFTGKANSFPSESCPWNGKIIIQAKHSQRVNASCSDSDFNSILKTQVFPSIQKLQDNNEVDYYLLFTNRKLSGIQDTKLEKLSEHKIEIESRLLALERINLWLNEYPEIAKVLKLNRLLMPIDFDEKDIQNLIIEFAKADFQKSDIKKDQILKRDIDSKNHLNNLSKTYFDNAIKKNITYFDKIEAFLGSNMNSEYYSMYLNTIDDINEEILIHRDEYDKFEEVLNHLYKYIIETSYGLREKRSFVRMFLHYMYYNCDIGRNE